MKAAWIIFRKELKETLRDRRTLLIMIVMPLLLIPVILGLATNITSSQADAEMNKQIRLAVTLNGNGAELMRRFALRKDLDIFRDIEASEYGALIKDDSLDVGLVLAADFDQTIRDGGTGSIEVFYNSTNEIPWERVRKTIDTYHEYLLENRLDSLGAEMALINPTEIEETDVYTQRENFGKAVGGFLPYIFVLFCLMGAMYPSIDLFTGEKERETLETILTVPATRLEILMGKLGTIVLSGVLSGGLAILGMYLAIQLTPDVPGFIRNIILQILSPASILQLLLLILPLTIFFAGILIPASIYARSFKEAQTVIQPMLIVVIIPLAIVAVLPNLSLNAATALIPIVNVGLASKDIIAGTMDPGLFLLVFLSLVALAGIGIALCIRWFGQEGNILRR